MTGCTACPVCGASASREVYRIEQAPVTCAAVFASAAQARAVPTGRVDLVVCEACGFLYNSAFDAETAQSGARYESSQAASAHFGSFAKQLANDWVERYQLRGQAIIEVGCGHGEFLAQMLAAGVGRGIGIDPLADPARVPIELRSQLRVLPERFESLVDTLAGVALICRHTLEHVADPARFLAAVRAWCAAASGRVALFEVPATERVLTEGAFWDIYYEHCNYFTERTLRQVFEYAGMRVLRSRTLYDGQYLVLEATVADEPVERIARPDEVAGAVAAAIDFGARVRGMVARCRDRLTALRADGASPVLWQGASKTVGLLTALGADHGTAFAVDLSPDRHDHFLPASALAVRAPAVLAEALPRHVVLMNPVYTAEVRAELDRLTPATQLLTINDLFAV